MSRFRGSVILLIVALVVLLVGGGLLYLQTRSAAEQLRYIAERTLISELDLPVQIGNASLSLLHGSVELYAIAIGDRAAGIPILTIDRARVVVSLTSLLRGTPRIRSLVISRPSLQFTDNPASSSTLTKLISGLGKRSDDREAGRFPIVLEQGTAAYRSTATPLALQINGLEGRLSWLAHGTPAVELIADDMMVRTGIFDLRKIRLHTRAHLTGDALQVEQITLAKAGSSLTVAGMLRPDAKHPGIDLNITGALAPEAMASQYGGRAPWKGHLALKGKIADEPGSQTVTASLLLEDGAGRPVGQTEATVRQGLLTLKRFLFDQGSSRLAIDGTVDLKTKIADLRLDLRGQLADLASWFPEGAPITGPLSAELRLTGDASHLTGGGRLEIPHAQFGSQRIDTLVAGLVVEGPELTIPSLTAHYHGIPFKASAAVAIDGRYRFALYPTRIDIASIERLAQHGGSGTLVVSLMGSGQGSDPRVEGELALDDLILREMKLGRSLIHFVLEEGRWRWELVGSRILHASGLAPLLLNGPLQIDASAANLDLDPLFQALRAKVRFPLRVHANGRTRLVGTLPELNDLTGWIDLQHIRGTAGSTSLSLPRPTRMVLEAGSVRIDSLELSGRDLAVTLMGTLGPAGRLDFSLSGHVPFEIIRPWLPAVRDLQGVPRLQLSLIGESGSVRVHGRAKLTDVQIKPEVIPIWIAVKTGQVTFDNDRIHYTVTEGMSAQGPLKGKGTARREGGSWHHTLEFTLDRANVDLINDQLLPERRWVSGTLSTRTALAFDTAPDHAALPTLQGQLLMRLEDGSLSHYPALVRLVGLLGAPAQPYRLPDLTKERMPYRRISADITVKNGVLHTSNLLLDSEVMRLTAVGQMTLADQRVDLDVAARPLQVLEQGIRRIPLLGRLLPKKQSLAVTYFDMKGPWDDPSISIAPVKSLSQTVRDLLLLLLQAPKRVIIPDR